MRYTECMRLYNRCIQGRGESPRLHWKQYKPREISVRLNGIAQTLVSSIVLWTESDFFFFFEVTSYLRTKTNTYHNNDMGGKSRSTLCSLDKSNEGTRLPICLSAMDTNDGGEGGRRASMMVVIHGRGVC
jgi:hypothetical protein